MEAEKEFVNNITKLDKSAFSLLKGLRSGLFVLLPFLFAPILGYKGAAFAALGGMWLTNTDGPKTFTPSSILLAASLAESVAVALGTITGAAGTITPLLVGIGVFFPMMVHGNSRWTRVGTFTAITFAVGVGLPGDYTAALLRAIFSVLGTLLSLLGIVVQRYLSEKISSRKVGHYRQIEQPNAMESLHPDALRNALTIGAASAVGFLIGSLLGLPRDFWIVVTIILTVQPSLNATLTFTSGMVLGTILGAVLGAAVVIGTKNIYLQLVFLSLFALMMFATSGVNLALVQVFLAPFIIILLNIIYVGRTDFAEARVIDVAIGGLVSIATVYVIGLRPIRKFWKKPS